jgi:cytochrome c oxidase subunit IV
MTPTDYSTQIKIPKWFWALAVIFLLWNLMGIVSFFGHTFVTEEALAKLPDNERTLYGDYPFWTTIIFAIATFGGLIGSIGLILKRKWSKQFFIISFLAIVPQMIHNVFFTKSTEVYGTAQAITMPVLVVLIGAILIWFSNYLIKKSWLK